MSSTSRIWGDDYVQIQAMLDKGSTPSSGKAQRVAGALFAQLEQKFTKLQARDQQIFRHAFFEALGTKATLFQILIDVHEGRCQTPNEAEAIGDGYMEQALQQ